jgi:hypothetical protein
VSNFIIGPSASARRRRTPSPATALRVQSSANGLPRPFGYGQARIAGNLIWYGNFTPTFVTQGAGGKGGGAGAGGKGTPGGGNYVYSTGVAFGLCEGPIAGVLQAWENKSAITLPPAGTTGPFLTSYKNQTLAGVTPFALFDGDYQQAPWPFLLTYDPAAAQNFRGLAYEACESLYLGQSSELPNFTWDVRFNVCGALYETSTIPGAAPYTINAAYFDWDYGVVEHLTVPNAAPYVVTPAVNPVAVNGIAATIAASGWYGSASVGVLWDAGAGDGTPGQPLTQVGSSPGPGQYSISGGDIFTFNPADAGQPVVIIDAALSPGVFFATPVTGTLVAGSPNISALSSMIGVAAGVRIGGPGMPPGAFIASVTGGSATGSTTNGSSTVSAVAGKFTAIAGTPVSDAAGALPTGTSVVSVTAPSVTAATSAAVSAVGVTFVAALTVSGNLADNQITNLSTTAGLVPGMLVSDATGKVNTTLLSISGTTATLAWHSQQFLTNDSFTFTFTFTGDVISGSATIANPSALAGVTTASKLSDSAGALPAGTSVSAVSPGSITMSHAATASVAADAVSFATQAVLSMPATQSGTSVALVLVGAPLQQVLSSPSEGQFTLSVQAGSFGQYGFAAADAGKTVLILDVPDADPADVLYDFLTNPYYGMTQFAAARIGDLSIYRKYCLAAGLLVSPTITSQSAASQFLDDLMTATNSELVWSAGQLTAVPYGDTALSANGVTYAPPAAPIYSFTDDDLLANQATNASSASAVATGDPVTVTRLDPADQQNDIKLEYLDRGNVYNPTIVEAKDDAAIALFGVKSTGSKELHLFCTQNAALASAQLMLGRQQVRRTFSFTVDRRYILLDPMDIVALNDANAGLNAQWVRIKEITENDDRSLSIVAEEYLQGSGAAPRYGHQTAGGYVANYNVLAPNVLTPVFFDAPVQIGNVLAMETIVATNGAGPNWGGCDVWISSDDVNFKYAGTLWGGTTMGTLTATFASGLDPDTVNTLSVDLTESKGILNGGTQADADQGSTLCLVDHELVSFEQATLTSQWHYDLGKHGVASGYLRRGFYGTTVASHSSGAPFVRLRPGSYFTIGYGAADIGTTVYVKLLSFNQWGGGKQTLDQVSGYSHTLGAPPVAAVGLLAGVIQTPDMALNAATAQLTVSATGPISLPVSPLNATLVSGSLTTEGNLVQIAYNAQFTNSGASPETAVWRVTYQGVNVLDSATITIQPGATATVAKQTTFTAPNQPGLFAMIAEGATASDSNLAASYVDLSVTELRR